MDINDKHIMEFKLGEGGFAKVYQAQCNNSGTAKAIKVIREAVKKYGRASAEIEVLQKCKHPNIIFLEDQIRLDQGKIGLVFPVYDMDVRQFIRRRRGLE